MCVCVCVCVSYIYIYIDIYIDINIDIFTYISVCSCGWVGVHVCVNPLTYKHGMGMRIYTCGLNCCVFIWTQAKDRILKLYFSQIDIPY